MRATKIGKRYIIDQTRSVKSLIEKGFKYDKDIGKYWTDDIEKVKQIKDVKLWVGE